MPSQPKSTDRSRRNASRAEWQRPELRRFHAGEAEAVGAVGDDGVIGTS